MDSSYDSYKVVFSTTLSNNKDRIFYARDNEQKFFFRNYDGENKSFIIKNIGTSENKEMTNGQLFLIIQSDNYIILIGNENSDIEILNLDLYQNDYDFIPQSTFLKGNRIIKGITSYCKVLDSYDLYCAIITASEDDPLNSYLSFYRQNLNSEDGKLEINYNYLLQFNEVKGNYISCFVDAFGKYFSCFYLSKDNNYTITLFEKYDRYLIKQNSLIVGSPSDPEDETIYFFKGISIGSDYAIYAYYSGDFNEVPTFIFKSINYKLFTFSDKYSHFSIVHLYDYQFNNGIEYNDLIKIGLNDFFFISTTKNKEILIIANFKIYSSNFMG